MSEDVMRAARREHARQAFLAYTGHFPPSEALLDALERIFTAERASVVIGDVRHFIDGDQQPGPVLIIVRDGRPCGPSGPLSPAPGEAIAVYDFTGRWAVAPSETSTPT